MRRALLMLGALAVLGVLAVAHASPVKARSAVFARGVSPSGEHWTASAGVSKNRRRNLWRFNLGFKFSLGFGWGSGQEIPIGSHERMTGQADGYTGILSPNAPESAAFGYAGPEVATIKMAMSDGSSLEVHPELPPKRLRRKFIWMRGLRYFIQYYPGGAYVTEYWLYDRAGIRVGCNDYAEGELEHAVCGSRPYTGT